MAIAHAALTMRMLGASVSPPTVTSRKRTGPNESVGGPWNSAADKGVTLPSSTEKKPLLTMMPACVSAQGRGSAAPLPSTMRNDIVNEPLRGAPWGSVRRP
ncbi:MAG: hypothetical protein IPO58_23345 [Betaproteobacteria bacterium]|nr:hypothetical protein [Betaproteobacteria bacterium]